MTMPDDPTPFQESNALLALLRDDRDRAEAILRAMLPGELRTLQSAAYCLAELCLTEGQRRLRKRVEGGADDGA
jgi:hypothetical protein